MNPMLTPHFKKWKQFTITQMAHDEKIAPLRATSETFNSRMTNDRGTSGIIRRPLFGYISAHGALGTRSGQFRPAIGQAIRVSRRLLH